MPPCSAAESRPRPSGRRTTALAALVGLALLAGCASGGLTRSSARQHNMPCSEAARVARGALLRLGYDGRVVTAPQPGTPGTISGTKAGGYSAMRQETTSLYTATVTVTCSNEGAQFDAATDEPFPASLTFRDDFAKAVHEVAARRLQRPPRADGRPETGVIIALEALRGTDVPRVFGASLQGITPVRLKIENRTERTYVFAAERVRLQMQEGDRATALSPARAAARAGAAAPALTRAHLADTVIAPGATIEGYLYFPAAAYRRATVALLDQATDEVEGFSVEF